MSSRLDPIVFQEETSSIVLGVWKTYLSQINTYLQRELFCQFTYLFYNLELALYN